jgi:hypothetical protein
MAKSDLLKEAIADARAVKETALANAKLALQEAFAPRIKEMLATEIENELADEDAMEADVEMDSMDVDAGMEGEGEGVEWVDNDISFSVGDETYDYEINEPADEEMSADVPAEIEADEFSEEGEEDLNLEAIIRELEGDLEMETAPEMEMDVEDEIVADGYMSDEDDEMMSEDIDSIIEAILREEEEAEEVEEADHMKEEMEAKEEELKEAYRTVHELKSILSEVNLLNAKLLYTNKLFRNFELNETQKMKVIENFDRAGTTREVKLVFTTLAESFTRPVKKRVVKESYASKAVATTAPSKATTQVLSEGFELANRWKKLAGLL